jgi:hypothetical protein
MIVYRRVRDLKPKDIILYREGDLNLHLSVSKVEWCLLSNTAKVQYLRGIHLFEWCLKPEDVLQVHVYQKRVEDK